MLICPTEPQLIFWVKKADAAASPSRLINKKKGILTKSMKKPTIYILATLLISLLLVGALTSCSPATLYSEGNGELRVVCTTFAPFEFAREVGGDRITVTILQDSGADLHNYTATSATLDALANADVFIYVGGTSDEKWVPNAIKASGNKELLTLCLMDHVSVIHAELENNWAQHDHDHAHDHEHDEDDHEHSGDEHIWTSVKNAKIIVSEIEKAFSQKDLEGAPTYSENAQSYTEKLDELDAEFAKAAAEASKKLVVFADRFPFVYLMHDYLIPYCAAFGGCSTEVNASFETQAHLIDSVKNNNLAYVLTIEGDGKTLAKSISDQTGCKILSLNSMQSIKRADIESGADYIEIMKQNLEILKEALE